MGTVVYYNQVQIVNALTRQWDQEVVYDPSNTDVLFHRFKLRFEGLVHAGGAPNPAYSVWQGGRGKAILNYQDIRSALGQARGTLLVTMTDEDGAERQVLAALPTVHHPNDPNRDVDNGPKPTGVIIEPIAGGRVFRVSFAIEVSKIECLTTTGTAQAPWVLNNRWSVSESMDEATYTTRTIRGQMRLSAPTSMIGDSRGRIGVPGLEPGFRRERMEFSTDESGLEVEYTITDKQVHTSAPWPARQMEVRHTEGSSDGANQYGEITVRLVGGPDAERSLLIVRALQIIDARMKCITQAKPDTLLVIPESASITEILGDENTVEAHLRITRPVNEKGGAIFNLRTDLMTAPLDLPAVSGADPYDPRLSQVPALYGYDPQGGERRPTVLLLLQCYLQHPCIDAHRIIGTPSQEPEEPDYGKLETEIVEKPAGEVMAELKGLYSPSAIQQAYTLCRIHSTYGTDEMVVQLPVASTSGESKFIELSPAQTRRVIEFDVESAGDWPKIPPPSKTWQFGTLKGRLLKTPELTPHPPTLAVDGRTKIFRVSGRYVYGLNRAPTSTEKLEIGVQPITSLTTADAAFDPAKAYDPSLGPGTVTTTELTPAS